MGATGYLLKRTASQELVRAERAVLDETIVGPLMLEQERLPPNEVDAFLRTALERTDGSEARSVGGRGDAITRPDSH